jgi:integrase/recombinase XerC
VLDGVVSWSVFSSGWTRFLQAANRSEGTQSNYLLATCQLAAYLASEMPGSGSADDPRRVTSREVIAFQVLMIESRSPATAVKTGRSSMGLTRFDGQGRCVDLS